MQLESESLLIRADAHTHVGAGHVMRCLALAQAWQDAGGHTIFMMAMVAPATEARLKSEGMEVIHLLAQPGSTGDAVQTADLAQKIGASWVVVDGYHFGADYQRIVKDSGLRLSFIDDNGHAGYYDADIVLNQNLHAHEDMYVNRKPYTQLLLGTRYTLLRREFLKWREWKREIPKVGRKVLVTLGGSDPNNMTLNVIQALQQVEAEGLEVVIVAGGGNPNIEELQLSVRGAQPVIRLANNVTSMSELMACADMAVSAGGSTCWELAFMGLPNLIIVLAENQQGIATGLEAKGVAINLGWHTSVTRAHLVSALSELIQDAQQRQKMSERGRQWVDGQGAARVAAILREVNV